MDIDVEAEPMRCSHKKWYKGFRIIALSNIDVYKPNKKLPTEYFGIMDPEGDNRVWQKMDTLEEAERAIDSFLVKVSAVQGKTICHAKDIVWQD